MRRRSALKAVASASVGVPVAGCLGDRRTSDGSGSPGRSTMTTAGDCPSSEQAPTCGGNRERVGAYVDDETPPPTAGDFELTADPTTLALGDCVTFKLTNRSDESKVTGIKEKYDVHRKTSSGWQSVLFAKSRAYNDLGKSHQPGMGFAWRRRLSQAGLSGNDRHVACEPLQSGTYRFVYWGGAGAFDALGVEFEVTE